MPPDVLSVADRLWNGEISTSTFHPVGHIGGIAEVTDGVAFCPSFANVSAFATDDGLVLVDTGIVPWPRGVHDEHAALVPAAAAHRRLLPRPHRPRLRRPGVGGGGGGRGLGRPRGRRPRGRAGPLRPLHRHRRLQRGHQPPPVRLSRTCGGPPSTATRTAPTRRASTSRSAASASSCTTRGARPTTTPGPGCPAAACCAAATSSSGRRPTPATPRRCSATRASGRRPCGG